MKITQFIPIMAGIFFSGQLLAAEPKVSTLQVHPYQDTMLVPAAPESAQPAKTQAAQLSPDDLDRVTAGVGRDNVAEKPWFNALIELGFSLHHNLNSDQGVIDRAGHFGVAVPSTVPNSFCIAVC